MPRKPTPGLKSAARRIAHEIDSGADPEFMVGEAYRAIMDFFSASRMSRDGISRALRMGLDEVMDEIADDSVSWSDSLTPIMPRMGRRRE